MSILSSVMGGLAGDGDKGTLMQLASQILDKVGGVQGLVGLLGKSGLAEQVKSWVGNGANLPVSGDQLASAFKNGGVENLVGEAAQKMGISTGDLHGKLASLLPEVVHHLTPDGQVPEGDSGSSLSSLAGLAGKLFG